MRLATVEVVDPDNKQILRKEYHVIEPGDRAIISTSRELNASQAQGLAERMGKFLSGKHRILIVDKDITVQFIKVPLYITPEEEFEYRKLEIDFEEYDNWIRDQIVRA